MYYVCTCVYLYTLPNQYHVRTQRLAATWIRHTHTHAYAHACRKSACICTSVRERQSAWELELGRASRGGKAQEPPRRRETVCLRRISSSTSRERPNIGRCAILDAARVSWTLWSKPACIVCGWCVCACVRACVCVFMRACARACATCVVMRACLFVGVRF